MFQDLSQSSTEAGFWRIWDAAQFIDSGSNIIIIIIIIIISRQPIIDW